MNYLRYLKLRLAPMNVKAKRIQIPIKREVQVKGDACWLERTGQCTRSLKQDYGTGFSEYRKDPR